MRHRADRPAEGPEPYVSENLSKETVKAAESLRGSIATPRALVVNSVRPKPDQINAAFLKACARFRTKRSAAMIC